MRGIEKCDDANRGAGDGCGTTCQPETGWACPKATSGAPLGGSCREICSDGQIVGSETCDDGNANGADGCDSGCRVEQGWTCPPSGGVCNPVCGDGAVRGVETCDEGNAVASGGCVTCQKQLGWSCNAGQTCTTTCGDGTQAGLEECDSGSSNNNNGDCSFGCTIASCSDLLLHTLGTGSETDVDCGGADCAPCSLAKSCAAREDCESNFCDINFTCRIPEREDDVFVMQESDDFIEIDISTLLANDEDQFAADFIALDGDCGEVTFPSPGVVRFDPSEPGTNGLCAAPTPPPAIQHEATFTYQVCSPAFPTECSSAALVTIRINRAPVITAPSVCVATGTASASLNIAASGVYFDADGNPIDLTKIYQAPFAPTVADDGNLPDLVTEGNLSRVGSTITWAPTLPDEKALYTIEVGACDDDALAATWPTIAFGC